MSVTRPNSVSSSRHPVRQAPRLAAALVWLAAAPACAQVAEPAQFRQDHDRDDVPATRQGAAVIDTDALAGRLDGQHLVVIDVLPAPVPPPDARQGLPHTALPHQTIPGTVWLPDVGRAPPRRRRGTFRARLAALSGGHRNTPTVFRCLSRCWMSWNAARRATGFGYTGVIWYLDGVDGWREAGHRTPVATPAP